MRWIGPTVSIVAAVGLFGCGSDESTDADYTAENREAFLAACTDVAVDDRLVRDVCECTYAKLVENVDVGELARIEETLRLDTLAALPEVVADHVAECVVSEADL